MARMQSTGISYFPLDVDFFSDRKTKIVKAKYGADGIAVYLYILCQVYRDGYYTRVDDDFIYMISDDLNMSADKVEQIMLFLRGRSMFNEQLLTSDDVITSTGIQRRWQEAVKTRAAKTPITVEEKYWLLEESETLPFIHFAQNENSSEKKGHSSEKNALNSEKNTIKKSKVNKSKVEESKVESSARAREDLSPPFTPPTVEEVAAYCRERGNKVDAKRFVNFYASKGWLVGNQPMRDWKACVRTWEGRESMTTTKERREEMKPLNEKMRRINPEDI